MCRGGDPTLGQHWGPWFSLVLAAAVPGGKLRHWQRGIHPVTDGHLGTGAAWGQGDLTLPPPLILPALVSTVTPWLRSHTCGALQEGDPVHTQQQPRAGMGVQVPVCDYLHTCVPCMCVHKCARSSVGGCTTQAVGPHWGGCRRSGVCVGLWCTRGVRGGGQNRAMSQGSLGTTQHLQHSLVAAG